MASERWKRAKGTERAGECHGVRQEANGTETPSASMLEQNETEDVQYETRIFNNCVDILS